MIEANVSISTLFGIMPAFSVCPEGEGPFPAVLFYMDAPGLRQELYEMARRIAAQGYYCLVPDLYYRLGTIRFDTARRDERMSAVVVAALKSINDDTTTEDTAGMLTFLRAQAEVRPGPVGAVGYCMSGRYVVVAANKFPGQIASAASIYGTQLVTDDENSPHKLISATDTELYFAFAETDTSAPPETIAAIRKAVEEAKGTHIVDEFAGTRHGYCFSSGRFYDPVSAEQTWAQLFALWERTLK